MSIKRFKIFLSWWYKTTGVHGYVYDFSVDCHAIAVYDILHIRKFLMRKNYQWSEVILKKCLKRYSLRHYHLLN